MILSVTGLTVEEIGVWTDMASSGMQLKVWVLSVILHGCLPPRWLQELLVQKTEPIRVGEESSNGTFFHYLPDVYTTGRREKNAPLWNLHFMGLKC